MKIRIRSWLFGPAFILLVWAAWGCTQNDENDFENCKYGQPEPIFSDSLQAITTHDFRVKDREGMETLVFTSGLKLDIIQSGCDAIRQELVFTLGDETGHRMDEDWVAEAVDKLNFLAGLGTAYAAFGFWAQAIEARKDAMKLSESLEVQPGFYVRIDPVASSRQPLLRIILSENP